MKSHVEFYRGNSPIYIRRKVGVKTVHTQDVLAGISHTLCGQNWDNWKGYDNIDNVSVFEVTEDNECWVCRAIRLGIKSARRS